MLYHFLYKSDWSGERYIFFKNSFIIVLSLSYERYTMHKGTLITIEGIDGAGKTVLLQKLTERLRAEHYSVVVTKEPGGTNIGKMLKKVLLEEEKECDPRVEFLLFAADRAEHFQKLVIPALLRGDIVISDRMADSALAYQGYGRGVDPHFIKKVNSFAMHGIQPDITFFLRISPEQALARRTLRNGEHSTMEREGNEFWDRVTCGYEKIIAEHSSRMHSLDAMKPIEAIEHKAYGIIKHFLHTHRS